MAPVAPGVDTGEIELGDRTHATTWDFGRFSLKKMVSFLSSIQPTKIEAKIRPEVILLAPQMLAMVG